jgi:hypothetical protein
MNNLDLKKKTFMKREFNQHIYKEKQIVELHLSLQMIHLMKLMLLARK